MKEPILPDFRKATHLAGVYCIEGEGGGGSVILRRFHDELSFRNEQTWTTKDRKRICRRLFGLRLVWPTCIFFASWSSMSGLKSEWAGNFQQSFFVCCAVLMSHKNGDTAVDGHNPALFWFISVSCCCWFSRSPISFAEFNCLRCEITVFAFAVWIPRCLYGKGVVAW